MRILLLMYSSGDARARGSMDAEQSLEQKAPRSLLPMAGCNLW